MTRFAKMHGLGNDFVVVDGDVAVDPGLVRRMCDRRFGVGGDGMLRVSTRDALVVMEYWNADGSTAEMCGNGFRCVARRAVDTGLVDTDRFTVLTPVGERTAVVGSEDITVELGPVTVGDDVEIGGRCYRVVSVGNPHAVTMVDDPAIIDVEGVGSVVEWHSRFPAGTNVEFVELLSPDSIRMRVWERGVGETLACGSGMVAAAARVRADGGPDRIAVQVPGGIASVSFEDDVAWLTGPAVTVFEGVWND